MDNELTLLVADLAASLGTICFRLAARLAPNRFMLEVEDLDNEDSEDSDLPLRDEDDD